MNTKELHRILTVYFSTDELKELCFELDINYDSLAGKNLGEKAMELIGHCERRGRLHELEKAIRKARPNAMPVEDAVSEVQPSPEQVSKITPSQPNTPTWTFKTEVKTPRWIFRTEVIVATLGFIGVVVAAYFSYLGVTEPQKVAIKATGTAEARLTSIAATATAKSTSTPTLTPTPTTTPTPTSTSSPSPTSTSSPTPTPITRIIADFESSHSGWLAGTIATPGFGANETAISATVSGGALQGAFDFRRTRADWPRATFITYTAVFEDWTSFDEIRFDAVALPPIQGNIRVTISVRTGSDCFNEYREFLNIGQRSIPLAFKLREPNYKTCYNSDDYRYPLRNPDRVIGVAIVVIPDPNDTRFAGIIQIDNVRLVQTRK